VRAESVLRLRVAMTDPARAAALNLALERARLLKRK
jgi:hypothetical protein